MRETIFVAVVAGFAGSLVGAGAVTVARPSDAPRAELDPKPLADAVERAVERAMSRGVADMRRAAAREPDAPAARPAPDAPAAPPPSFGETVVRRAAASTHAEDSRDSPFDTLTPPPNYLRFRPLQAWSEDPKLRQRWMFADEATCLAWFGTPDDVNADGSGEVWVYRERRPDADGDGKSDGELVSCIVLNRGRVTSIDAANFE